MKSRINETSKEAPSIDNWLSKVASISLPIVDATSVTTDGATDAEAGGGGAGQDVAGAVTIARSSRAAKRRIPVNAFTIKKILCEDVPDDTTLKSNVRIVANFDLSPMLGAKAAPLGCEECVLSDTYTRRQREWKVSQVVWCFPPSKDTAFVLEQATLALSRDAAALGRSGNSSMYANIEAMRQLVSSFQSEWQEAMYSVVDLFLERKVPGFAVSAAPPMLGATGSTELCATFYMSSMNYSNGNSSSDNYDRDSDSTIQKHFCAMTGANSVMLRRLIDMDIDFRVVAPPGASLDNADIGASATTSSSSSSSVPVPPMAEESSIGAITYMSSSELQAALNSIGLNRGSYSIILCGEKAIRGAVDCIMEKCLYNSMDVLKPNEGTSDTIRFGENVALPRIISSKPFSHATIVECDAVDAALRQAARVGATSGVSVEDVVTLRGLFDTTCVQRLIGLLIACAAMHKHSQIAAPHITTSKTGGALGGGGMDVDAEEKEEFIDESCLEQATLLATKQAAVAPPISTNQISLIRNPFEIDMDQDTIIPEQILDESPEEHPDRLYFYITLSDPIGVPYYQAMKKKKRKTKRNDADAASIEGESVKSFTAKVVYWSNDLLPSDEQQQQPGSSGRLTNESSQASHEDCSHVSLQAAVEVTVEQRSASRLLTQSDIALLHQRLSAEARGSTVLPALKEY